MKYILLGCMLLVWSCFCAGDKPKVLIVFAHQEPQSFAFALRNTVFQSLVMSGYQVKLTNLVQLKMILSLDKTDFTELQNKTYFHPQEEQHWANQHNRATFSPELKAEHDKVEWADYILLIHPYYFWYMPGIMKSWMERVFSYGFAYGDHHLTGKKAMMLYCTGAPPAFAEIFEKSYWDSLHDVFDFMGVQMLKPFVAYAVQHITELERKAFLVNASRIVADLVHWPPYIPS